MSTGMLIGGIVFALFILYIMSQILDFYGVSSSSYGYYMGFYAFLALSVLVLPTADSGNEIFGPKVTASAVSATA